MATERIQRRIDRLLDQVEEAADQEDWEVVRRITQQVLALDPDNADAPAFSAAAEQALGNSPPEPVVADKAANSAPKLPTAPTAISTSFANGRYQVKAFLGEGGKKRVYQAHDTVLDRDVALAVIKTEGLDPTSRVRITRERHGRVPVGISPFGCRQTEKFRRRTLKSRPMWPQHTRLHKLLNH